MSIEGKKVVTASEMALIEKGISSRLFMQNAGTQIAIFVKEFVISHGLSPVVTLLVGKGNNGGDTYFAGSELLKMGFRVSAFPLYPLENSSPLCQEMYHCFIEAGGSVDSSHQPSFEGVILDGLLGTGFRGKIEGPLAALIELANESELPILAVDIPSGLNGDTGEVQSVAIQAVQTLCLGLPKSGFFLNQGWDHVGDLVCLDFGLKAQLEQSMQPVAYLLDEERISQCFPPLRRGRHKYEAGYVLAVAGSSEMPGAALLSCLAALRSGAGIVRLFYPPGMQEGLAQAPYELIREIWEGNDLERILLEAKRAKVILLGPGMGRGMIAEKKCKKLLSKLQLPFVVDADALFFLAKNPSWEVPKGSVLTPHRGEMAALLSSEKQIGSFEESCQFYADKKQITLVLKGAVTWIFHPGIDPLISIRGDPGMATAGSGDVLTGMIAAFIAQGLNARIASSLAVYLHGLSGEIAAEELTSYCLTASSLIDYLPDAFFCGKGMA